MSDEDDGVREAKPVVFKTHLKVADQLDMMGEQPS